LKEEGRYKLGIDRRYYRKILQKSGLDPDAYGPVLFKNYEGENYLLVRESIISVKTLKQELTASGLMEEDAEIPSPVRKIYDKSMPKFKTQAHFYGYDGRGNDPTLFDCNYTYNLGLTVFSLIANGSTGQMAAIQNLEREFSEWRPIGIPIAPLMHLEERKGKLALVIEKSVVDINSNAFRLVKSAREKWLAAHDGADDFRRPGPVRFRGKSEEDRPITLVLNAIGG
jgi:pyrophosphate--fructose-6-phosphate 1-phosphotransferase